MKKDILWGIALDIIMSIGAYFEFGIAKAIMLFFIWLLVGVPLGALVGQMIRDSFGLD